MARHLLRPAVLAVLALALLALSGNGDTTYEAPFAIGPSGGDQFNHIEAAEDGTVSVFRAYPHPGGIGCPGRAGYARLEVAHEAHAPVEAIDVAFTDAVVDAYAFVIADVRTADGTYIGSRQQRGLLAGDGVMTMPVQWPDGLLDAEDPTADLTIQIGVQLSGACPSANAATLRFTTVTVHESQQQ